MKVHHLSAGTMCPRPARLVNGSGSWIGRGRLVCHCLVLETAAGIFLVDTGIGLNDVANPKKTLGRIFLVGTGARLDEGETLVRQLGRLGLKADDVRGIVPTHLDLDHAGGLADCPRAKVHIREPEHRAATLERDFHARFRYPLAQLAHGPDWQLYPARGGEKWFGFEGVQSVAGTQDEVLLIPLDGHTWGHAGVAIKTGAGWLLHAGDAYFSRHEVAERAWCPAGLALFQWYIAADRSQQVANRERLRQLVLAHSDEVRVFCAHDPEELASFAG